ncbi:unnamed protein product [Mytilus coruscus]|uniref:C-type lectin domain-containing protein n=1 Tax=Mytilus coruscus TaxID=42192 RepID=A0A6J8DI47_MYTCO|nr:unnamed protein product [Mytilus coruscus]
MHVKFIDLCDVYFCIFSIHEEAFESLIFKTLPSDIPSTESPDYVFQHASSSMEECAVLCTKYSSCNSAYLHQSTCIGLSSLSPDSSHPATVGIYTKQTEACQGSKFLEYKDMCIMVSELALSWYEAKQYCEDVGGHLIVLDSEKKNNSTREFIKTYYKGSFNGFYVGASDLAIEGKWEWIIPSAANYFNFYGNQPNNVHIKNPTFPADCAAVHTDGTLFDDYCGQKQAFICEI